MRAWILVAAIALAGCSTEPAPPASVPSPCGGHAMLFLGPGHSLLPEMPAASMVAGNGFEEAFLVDEMDEWRSQPWPEAMRITGNLTLEFWVQNDGTPAPVVVGGDPGQGYHFFNQFGTDRGFVADYGREYAEVLPEPGSVHHYIETIPMPPGGLYVEPGDTLRLLLTSLVLTAQETGQHVLIGGDTPSHVSFEHHCMAALEWEEIARRKADVAVHGHQGLITGAVPATEGVNHVDVGFELLDATQRLTITLRQTSDTNPLKDDMDLTILDAQGTAVTSIGSPYADETGTFYAANLAAMMPPGEYVVRVDSYSGHAYRGVVTIIQDRAALPAAL